MEKALYYYNWLIHHMQQNVKNQWEPQKLRLSSVPRPVSEHVDRISTEGC